MKSVVKAKRFPIIITFTIYENDDSDDQKTIRPLPEVDKLQSLGESIGAIPC